MQDRIGIGITTYNRKDLLRETIDSVRRFTRRDDVDFVVADDGSIDGTVAMLRADGVPVVSGVNMGVAWNKNRALYLLGQALRCAVVILLEDDTMPSALGWEDDWIAAARRWGHINYAGDWFADQFIGGVGTPEDPILSRRVTAQCAAYSREALDWGGYFDTRFRGYGHEHVEHTRRLIRVGFGGTDDRIDGREEVRFALIHGAVALHDSVSTINEQQVARNLGIAHQAMADHGFRAPWRDVPEMKQFRSEILGAMASRPQGFALRPARVAPTAAPPAPRRPGLWARLFRSAA